MAVNTKPKIRIVESQREAAVDLINEDGCRVIFAKRWLLPDTADRYRDHLKDNIEWIERKSMANNPNTRRIYSCGQMIYDDVKVEFGEWTPLLEEVKQRLELEMNTPINSCLLNEYRDGSSYISWHQDKEIGGPNKVVVTISLGGPREFYLRHVHDKDRKVKVHMESGDCLVMTGETQRLWQHCVPKRAHADYRISMTYRYLVMP